MLRLLARLFIKDRQNTADPKVRERYGTLASVVGVALNLLLALGKGLVGFATGSIAATADALNNLSDAGSSIITLVGFRVAGKRGDGEHPFGHGRAEYISGLIVALIIMLMGFDLAKESIIKIFKPEPVEFTNATALVLAASILVKIYMAAYNRSIGKKIQSVSMRATAMDSLSDAVATSAVLASALIGRFFGLNIDAYAGIVVSLLILYTGLSAAKDTIDPLLGNPPDPEFIHRVGEILSEYPVVTGYHDLVVHDYGAGRRMISLHAEVPADGDLMEIHDAIDLIERRISTELDCHAVIHMDPVATDDLLVNTTKTEIVRLLTENLAPGITIHDFRMVPGSVRTKVLFDAVIPLDVHLSDQEIILKIKNTILKKRDDLDVAVTIDRPYA